MARKNRTAVLKRQRERKKMEKAEGLSSDEMKAGEAELQELTEEHCRQIDKAVEAKTAELMEV